jgi:hypothetical protein
MLDFDSSTVRAALLVHLDALVVVVDRHRQLLLGGVLADHVLIQVLLQFQRLRQLVGSRQAGRPSSSRIELQTAMHSSQM